MIDIFVSYSRKDREIVKKLVEVMKGRGWSVWWDPTIRPGEYFEDVIENALTASKCVIVVWSKNAVASKWVRAEAAEAANRGVLVPVVIDDAKIPFRFKQIQEAQLADWQFTPDHPELVRLLDSIAEKLIQAQDAPTSQSAGDSRDTEAPPLPPAGPPLLTQKPKNDPVPQEETDQQAGLKDASARRRSSSPIEEYVALVDRDWRSAPEASQSEKTRPLRPAPVVPQTAEYFETGEQPRPPIITRRSLVIPLLIIIGLVAAGAIYFFALRKPATDYTLHAELDPQTRESNQQLNVNNASPAPATPTSSVAPSPVVTPTGAPADNSANARKTISLLKGKWQSQNAATSDCECANSACLDIQFGKIISNFCVESSQVYVSAEYKLDAANNKVYLFFKAPNDLGAGASRMPWDKFDTTKPIATIDLSDLEAQRIIYVAWHGFTEAGAAKQRWRHIGSGYSGTYMRREGKSFTAP